jgi:phage terminase large subunit GpA-like protein
VTAAAVLELPDDGRAEAEAAARARAAAVESAVFREVFAPRVRMTLLEWAEQRRMLSPEANALAAEAGGPVRYSSALTPYHREPMLALSDPRTEYVVCKFPSQDGKTEILNNFIGWKIDTEPGPMLVLQPTKEMAEAWSKDRLAPMIRDTKELTGKVRDARSRDSENTILHKKFPGGHLSAVGSNSPAGLASRPIRDVVADEVDRCARSAGTEGDSLRLAFRRTTTFRKGKKLLISSPTIRKASRIDAEYTLGTQEEWLVPCPHCQEQQFLIWGGPDLDYGLKWERDQPETAHYVCINGCVIEEHHKGWMIERGTWVAKNPDAGPRRRSFWKSALTSNLVSWAKLVYEWSEVQGKPEELQQFVNTVLCELWDPIEGEEIGADGLLARLGVGYPEGGAVPDGVAVLTRSVDTQGDRLETAVWGWGEGEEAWLLEHDLIVGDPSTTAPWKELTAILKRRYRTVSGVELAPRVTFIDSGGHATQEVYSYTKTRNGAGVFAIKGANTEGAPLLSKPTRNNSARAILYLVGSFTGKESLMRRLSGIHEPGPRFIHLPADLDGEQVAQFTRERLITRVQKGGKRKRVWETLGRNEMIDLYVYALAGLHKLGIGVTQRLGEIAKRQAEGATKPAPNPSDPPTLYTPPKPPRSGGGWVNGWK